MKRSRFLTVVLSASLLFTMRAEARAQGNPQPGPWTGFGTSLFATGTDVWVKFFGADASFTSQLLFVCDLSSSCQQLVFQNNDPSVVGQEIQIAHTFTVGQEVIFKLFVTNTGDTWYTGDASRNSDGFAHFGKMKSVRTSVLRTCAVFFRAPLSLSRVLEKNAIGVRG